MSESTSGLAALDEQILGLIHHIDAAPSSPSTSTSARTPTPLSSSAVPPSPAASASPAFASSVRPSSRPPASSSSSSTLRDRQARVECLCILSAGLHRHCLLSSYQLQLLLHSLHAHTPRYLQVVDSFLQAEAAYELAVRTQLKSPTAPLSAAWGAPPAPPSLCNAAAHSSDTNPSAIPLSSLLSSSAVFRAFSPSLTLHRLLTAALLHSLEEVWLATFMGVPTSVAKRLSKAERSARQLPQPSLVYGELTLRAMAAVLWPLRLPSGGTLIDLGSGSGRGVVGALLLHDWDVVRGVELLDGLWKASVAVKDKVERERRGGVLASSGAAATVEGGGGGGSGMEGGVGVGGGRRTRIVLERADFFDVDWSEGDVVLANSTCFDEAMMHRLAQQGRQLKQGAYCMMPHTAALHSHTPQHPVRQRPSAARGGSRVVDLLYSASRCAAVLLCGVVWWWCWCWCWWWCSHHVDQEAVLAPLPPARVRAVRDGHLAPQHCTAAQPPLAAEEGEQSSGRHLPSALLIAICLLCLHSRCVNAQSWGLATANVHQKVTPAQKIGGEDDEEEEEEVEEGQPGHGVRGAAFLADLDSGGAAAQQPRQRRQEAVHGHG